MMRESWSPAANKSLLAAVECKAGSRIRDADRDYGFYKLAVPAPPWAFLSKGTQGFKIRIRAEIVEGNDMSASGRSPNTLPGNWLSKFGAQIRLSVAAKKLDE
jgi:hypothetical protein